MAIQYNPQREERMHPEIEDKINTGQSLHHGNAALPDGYIDQNASKTFNKNVEQIRTTTGKPNADEAYEDVRTIRKQIQAIEQPVAQQLEQLAIQIVEEQMGMQHGDVDWDVKLGTREDIDPSQFQFENKDEKPEIPTLNFGDQMVKQFDEEDIKKEVDKQRIINSFTQGAAQKAKNMFFFAQQELNQISPQLVQLYKQYIPLTQYRYWTKGDPAETPAIGGAMSLEQEGEEEEEEQKIKITATATTFVVLLAEMTKGVMEVFALHNLPLDRDIIPHVKKQTESLQNERWDIRLGQDYWGKLLTAMDVTDPRKRAQIYTEIVKLPAEEFNALIKGVLSGDQQAKQKIQELGEDLATESSLVKANKRLAVELAEPNPENPQSYIGWLLKDKKNNYYSAYGNNGEGSKIEVSCMFSSDKDKVVSGFDELNKDVEEYRTKAGEDYKKGYIRHIMVGVPLDRLKNLTAVEYLGDVNPDVYYFMHKRPGTKYEHPYLETTEPGEVLNEHSFGDMIKKTLPKEKISPDSDYLKFDSNPSKENVEQSRKELMDEYLKDLQQAKAEGNQEKVDKINKMLQYLYAESSLKFSWDLPDISFLENVTKRLSDPNGEYVVWVLFKGLNPKKFYFVNGKNSGKDNISIYKDEAIKFTKGNADYVLNCVKSIYPNDESGIEKFDETNNNLNIEASKMERNQEVVAALIAEASRVKAYDNYDGDAALADRDKNIFDYLQITMSNAGNKVTQGDLSKQLSEKFNMTPEEADQKINDFRMQRAAGSNFVKQYLPKSRMAADISDSVSPMGWENGESKKDQPDGAGAPLPPNQNLQNEQPTQKAPADANVLYDSNQDSGPQFQTTVNPKDKSVTVKFVDSPEEQALNQAIGAPPQGQPGQAPPAVPALGGSAKPNTPVTPNGELSDKETPVSF